MLTGREVAVGIRPDNPHRTLHVGLGARTVFHSVSREFDELGPTLGAGDV